MKKISNKIIYLQYLKCIAIVLVLFCHCCQMVPRVNSMLVIFSTLCLCGVPIFLMVNGALLFNKPIDTKKHVHKMLLFFIQCNIWAIIVGIINYIEYKPEINFELAWFFRYFSGNTNIPNTGHLWYMRSLIALYLIFPCLKMLYDKNYKYFCFILSVCFVCSFATNTLNTIFSYGKSNVVVDIMNWIPFDQKTAAMLFYFGIGAIIHKRLYIENRRKFNLLINLFILIGCATGLCLVKIHESGIDKGLLVISYGYERCSTCFLSISALIIILICVRKKRKTNKIIDYIGSNTLGIYFVHMIWLLPVRYILKFIIFDKGSLLWSIIETLLTLLFSIITIELLKKIPIVNKLVR